MYRFMIILSVIFSLAVTAGCGSGSSSHNDGGEGAAMYMKIDDVPVAVEWEDNASVKALREVLPLTVKMHMYGDFEQVGGLGRSLPRDDERITTNPGDIVLYSGNQIVIFYGNNTWAYTRLGKITDKTASELADMLGKSDVTLEIAEE